MIAIDALLELLLAGAARAGRGCAETCAVQLCDRRSMEGVSLIWNHGRLQKQKGQKKHIKAVVVLDEVNFSGATKKL